MISGKNILDNVIELFGKNNKLGGKIKEKWFKTTY
jgi:hypothetical protein